MEEQVAEEQEAFEEEEAEDTNEPAPEPEEEVEPEPEPESGPVGFTPEQLQKAERAIGNQRKKLGEILTPEYVAHDCLLCGGLGFTPDLPPGGSSFSVIEDEGGLRIEVQAPLAESGLEQAKDKGPCDECNALGMVLTGSRNPNAQVAPCGKCSGNGWIIVARDTPAPLPQFVPGMPNTAPTGGPAADVGIDAWGRPAGHQHWGVPPASIPG